VKDAAWVWWLMGSARKRELRESTFTWRRAGVSIRYQYIYIKLMNGENAFTVRY
jgi:hypothetical protein